MAESNRGCEVTYGRRCARPFGEVRHVDAAGKIIHQVKNLAWAITTLALLP